MLDYYSHYSSPTKEEAIKEVLSSLDCIYHKDVNEETIVRSIIEPMPCLGSLAGWMYRIKSDIIKQVKRRVHNRKVETYWVQYVMRKITGDATFTY